MQSTTDQVNPPLIAIACQGGGSHAAFGAGVIHRLLDDHGRQFQLLALSGTSGGAINVVLTWSGLIQGGKERGPAEAQRRLKGMWDDLAATTPPDFLWNLWGQFVLNLPFTWEVSPYAWDLGACEEMVSRLKRWANLEAMPHDARQLNDPYLLIGTTDIRNGVSVAIRGDGKTVTRRRRKLQLADEPFDYSDVIASIAIPPLYKEVHRRGTSFWDGLFSTNPPIYALTDLDRKPQELWIIQINPQGSARPPRRMRDIADRRNELSGNVSLNKELDMIETVNAMFDKGHLKGTNYRHIIVRIVGIEEEESNLDLSHASKFDRSPEFLRALFDRGRERAPEFYKPTSLRDEVTHRIRRSRLPLR